VTSTLPKIPKTVQLGHPALTQVASPVEVDKVTLNHLADGLDAAYRRLTRAAGLALPQLGIPLRGFVMSGRYFTPNRFRYCFNPEILSFQNPVQVDDEGCFSLPGQQFKVSRYLRINVRYIDRNGKTVEEFLWPEPARVFQHELDHLDGILINDPRRAIEDPKA
jgi:peptide deformylase